MQIKTTIRHHYIFSRLSKTRLIMPKSAKRPTAGRNVKWHNLENNSRAMGSYRKYKNGRMWTLLKLPDGVYDTTMFTLRYALNFSIIKCKSK